MKEQKLRSLMFLIIAMGLCLVLLGIYLIVFTNTATQGSSGIFKIAGLIAGGLFISVPAKIYLTLQLMRANDEKVKSRNAQLNEN
jgi:uncharacterized membrane protein